MNALWVSVYNIKQDLVYIHMSLSVSKQVLLFEIKICCLLSIISSMHFECPTVSVTRQ